MPPLLQKTSLKLSISKKWSKITKKKTGVDVDESTTSTLNSSDHTISDERKTSSLNGYGYSLPHPDSKKKQSRSQRRRQLKLEHNDPVPDVAIVSDTSSEDENEQDDASKYGYGDASPDSEPIPAPILSSSSSHSRRRRSSIQRPSIQRPSSSATVTTDNNKNVPFHPQRMPRRSSLKGASSCISSSISRKNRRASLGASAATAMAALDAGNICAIEELEFEEDPKFEDDPRRIIKVQLPGRKGPVKRRCSITFSEEVNVRKVVPAKTLTQEPEQLWFQDNEYVNIKKKTIALLQKVGSDGVVDGRKYCTRGLERYMVSKEEREGLKYGTLDAVLFEQRLQRKKGTFDDESVARKYTHTTVRSIAEAARRANLDAEEVASFNDYNDGNVYVNANDATAAAAAASGPPRRSRARRRASVA